MLTIKRKSILARALRGLVALLTGALAAAVVSADFREFVGDGPYAAVILAVVPSLVLALDKWARDWKGRATPEDPAA